MSEIFKYYVYKVREPISYTYYDLKLSDPFKYYKLVHHKKIYLGT